MRSKSGFQPSVPVMNQGGALDRAAKSDALIADVKCRAHVLNVIKCVFTNQRHDRPAEPHTNQGGAVYRVAKSDVDALIADVKSECDQMHTSGNIGIHSCMK